MGGGEREREHCQQMSTSAVPMHCRWGTKCCSQFCLFNRKMSPIDTPIKKYLYDCIINDMLLQEALLNFGEPLLIRHSVHASVSTLLQPAKRLRNWVTLFHTGISPAAFLIFLHCWKTLLAAVQKHKMSNTKCQTQKVCGGGGSKHQKLHGGLRKKTKHQSEPLGNNNNCNNCSSNVRKQKKYYY